jgi:TRAP-type C4-dicarboxylate transport system substrate-binding protein
MHFMSKKKFESLPKEVRDVLQANMGEEPSRAAGAYFDSAAKRARAPVAASDKHKLVTLTPTQYDSWKKKVAVINENWAKERTGGQQVMEAFIKHYNDAAAGR